MNSDVNSIYHSRAFKISQNMSDSSNQNGTLNGAGIAEQDNLVKIRDILFGNQVGELSAKIKNVETEFNKQLGSLKSIQTRSTSSIRDRIDGLESDNRDLVQSKIASLESAVHKDVEEVGIRVAELQTKLSELVKSIEKSNRSIEKKLEGINEKLTSMKSVQKDLGASTVSKATLAETLTTLAKGLK